MGRKEDLNNELDSYLSYKVKPKLKPSKRVEEVPSDISDDKVHVIEGQPTFIQRVMSRLKERSANEPEPEYHEPQMKVEEDNENFEKEEQAFEEEKPKGGFMQFLKDLFTTEGSPEDYDVPPEEQQADQEQKPELSPDAKRMIEKLIQINVEALSHLPQEDLEKFRRSESYQTFKDQVAKFKELTAPKPVEEEPVEEPKIQEE